MVRDGALMCFRSNSPRSTDSVVAEVGFERRPMRPPVGIVRFAGARRTPGKSSLFVSFQLPLQGAVPRAWALPRHQRRVGARQLRRLVQHFGRDGPFFRRQRPRLLRIRSIHAQQLVVVEARVGCHRTCFLKLRRWLLLLLLIQQCFRNVSSVFQRFDVRRCCGSWFVA